MLKQVLIWPRPVKRAVVMTVDIILSLLATWSAYSIRMGTFQWPLGAQWFVYVLSPVLAIPIFLRFGLYRTIFRYFGLDALLTTGKAVALYALAFIGLLLWPMWPTFPLTWGILQPILFFLLVGASRVLAQKSLPSSRNLPSPTSC